jgi:hypothetical protein
MKQFNSIDEMQPYLNEKENAYEFIENGEWLDIEINFDLTTDKNIFARDINAWHINAWNITAGDITAGDIKAKTIKANTILFDVVCFACHNIICKYIKGTHGNSKYFSLYGEIIIKEEK